MIRSAPPTVLVGWIGCGDELIQVASRAREQTGLWLLRYHPAPRVEYGSVHSLLGEPVYEPSAWTTNWPESRRHAVASATAAVFRGWIDEGMPTPLVALGAEVTS